jgi:hypothetical protein
VVTLMRPEPFDRLRTAPVEACVPVDMLRAQDGDMGSPIAPKPERLVGTARRGG